MATTKLSTDVIDLSTNTGGLIIPSGITSNSISVEYLIVAGGGGSSNQNSGGGGAGGLLTATISASTINITIGEGGALSNNVEPPPSNSDGDDSTLSGSNITLVTVTGGGRAGTRSASSSSRGGDGGSGGGGGSLDYGGNVPGSGNTPSTTPSQGFDGGVGQDGGNYRGGGGGGAGAVGASSASSGNGGIGLDMSSIINATNAASASVGEVSGSAVYFAGGGGAGANSNAGLGALGGGGNGGTYSQAGQGTEGTGGGAGGGSFPTTLNGAKGGRGVVVLRYKNGSAVTSGFTAEAGPYTEGDYKVLVLKQGSGTVVFTYTGPVTGRPTSPTEGLLRDNITTGALEFYDGSLWQQISGTLVADPPVAADNFSTILWNGNATARSIAVGFAPGLVWLKNTNNSTNSTWSNSLFDTSRSSGFRFVSDSTAAEQNYSTHFSGISSTGFNLPSSQVFNDSGGNGTYVSWNWKAGGATVTNNDGSIVSQVSANVAAGFSMVKYIGNYTAGATVGHGLEGEPDLIIFKPLTPASGWKVYCSKFASPTIQVLELYTSAVVQTYSGYFNNTSPTVDVFSMGAYNDFNRNNTTGMAYCWRSITGYSKIGTYTGTSAAGNFQETGFEPSWIMVKSTSVANTDWVIVDNKRTSGSNYYWIYANKQDANEGPYGDLVFNSNGFTVSTNASFSNQSGGTYIYMAFA